MGDEGARALNPNGRRILIVDDDVHLADNLAEIVTLAGYEAITVHSLEDALGEVGRRSVDVIVTDNRLSGMSGAGLVSKLRSHRKGVPIVLITAWPEDGEGAASRDGAVTRFVCRPIDVPRLLSTLRALLGTGG
jgi:DNA-binding response OmpR family regulator